MNSYLDIAEIVLKKLRQPLDARQILQTAYQLSLVPPDLYGKTQHKTLHARLAADIRNGKSKSIFIRTAPGRFFLRAFLTDATVPEHYKREYPALPRSDQLQGFHVICLDAAEVPQLAPSSIGRKEDLSLANAIECRLSDAQLTKDSVVLRTFVIAKRLNHVAIRRRSFNGRDGLNGKSSVGCFGYVKATDRTMFSDDPAGIRDAAIRTAAEQLDISWENTNRIRREQMMEIIGIIAAPIETGRRDIAALAVCRYPEDLDPIARFVGEGMFYWHPVDAHFNDIQSFDPWSRSVVESGVMQKLRHI